MNKEIEHIGKICKQYVTEPKLLIVPSISLKGQIQKTLMDAGIFSANLTIDTVDGVAYKIVASEISNMGIKVIDNNGMEDLVREVLTQLKEAESLKYFDALEVTTGLSKVIAKTISEIKYAGFCKGMITLDKIKNKNKYNDLNKIIKAYQKKLLENKCMDFADILDKAIKKIETTESEFSVVYALEECRFTWLEKEFLLKLKCELKEDDDTNYLDYKAASSNIKDITFKRTYGDSLEVKEVIRTIINNNIPFDKVLIVGFSSEPYSQLLYQLLSQYTYRNEQLGEKIELPITFGAGLPIAISSPSKFIMTLLTWISNGYDAHDFVNIIASGAIKIKSEIDDIVISRMGIISVIKSSGLTWQRSTYLKILNKYKAVLEKHNLQARQNLVEYIIKLLENDLFPNIPEPDENGIVDLDEFISGIKQITRSLCNIKSSMDSEAYNAIFDELDKIIKGKKLPIIEICQVIMEHIDKIRINIKPPLAGKIHFTTYHGAWWAKREYTFLIGGDVLRFPSNANENPILLDEEREENLSKSKDIITNNIKDMSRFLLGITKNLSVSYAYFDTAKNRENYPSLIFNSMVENMADKSNKSYYEYEKEEVKPINFVLDTEEDCIDETDFILQQTKNKDLLKQQNNIMSYEMVEDIKREEDIEIGGIENNRLVISPSSLMVYISCSYKYYLKYILGLKAITNKEIDRLGWMSHIEIGRLYHEIFEKFENKVKKNSDVLINEEIAVKEITKIFKDTISKYEDELPVASKYHISKEKETIIKNITRFAKLEVRDKDSKTPLLLEYNIGQDEPCVLDLGNESIHINGIIDRVDILNDTNELLITDYKTGSTYGYDILNNEKADFINEKSIQPILYYLALKDIAKKSTETDKKIFNNVTRAVYYFVTDKGDYEKFYIDFDEKSELICKENLQKLISWIKDGRFNPNKEKCRYCEYSDSCQYRGGE